MAIDSVSDMEHGLTRRLTEAGFSVFVPGSDGMPSLVAAHPSFGLIAIDLVDHAERASVELNRKVARLRNDVPEVDRVRTRRVVVAGDLDTSDGDMIAGTDAAAGSFLRDLSDRPMEQAAIDALVTFFAPRVSIEVPRRRPMADEDAADRAKQRLLLDATQSAIARREVDDVLVITGPPGSGKTLVLAARAKWLAAQHPGWRIVLLCYNRLLVPYLESLVWGHANISVHTFGQVHCPTPGPRLTRQRGVG